MELGLSRYYDQILDKKVQFLWIFIIRQFPPLKMTLVITST